MNNVWHLTDEEMPEPHRRVLTFSPIYPQGEPVRYRILEGQYVKLTKEVRMWAYLEDLLP